MSDKTVFYKLEKIQVTYTKRFFPDHAYYDIIFTAHEIIFVNKDDSLGWEAGLRQLGFIGQLLVRFFTRKHQDKLKLQRTKSLDQQMAEDKHSRRFMYGEILQYSFKKGNAWARGHLALKTAQGSYTVILQNNDIEILEEKLKPLWKLPPSRPPTNLN